MLGKIIEGKRRGEQQRMRWWDGNIDETDMSLKKDLVMHREAWCTAVHRVKMSQHD